MEQYFIVTIDTEETGLWSKQFQAIYDEVDHIMEIPRLQEVFDRYQVKPSYLIDYPIVSHRESSKIIRKIFESARCEIGAHMHPWCNPPFEEEKTAQNSFFCNLDPSLQEKKLESLTKVIEENIGFSPRVFRAGRFGFDEKEAPLLTKFGYLVDSSITPFMDWSSEGGPNFENKPFWPYWIEEGTDAGKNPLPILEIPVSVGFNRIDFEHCHKIFKRLESNQLARRLHLIGILDRLSLLEKIVLTPEVVGLKKLKHLACAYKKRGLPVLNMYLHSSSMKPGGSPYIRSDEELKNFLKKVGLFIDFLCNRLGFKNTTLMGYREKLLQGR